jgi:hypothetical protein
MCPKRSRFGHLDNFSNFYLMATFDFRRNDKIFTAIRDDVYFVEINFLHVALFKSSSFANKTRLKSCHVEF